MLDIKFVRENPELVKENIKKKFQDAKLPLVDEVLQLDAELRAAKSEAEALRASRNKLSKNIGALMAQGKKEEAEAVKRQVTENADRLKELEAQEAELSERLRKDMMTIPNIIDASVPIGKDDSENVEVQRFGEPAVPDFEVPYHTDIMERFDGIDLGIALGSAVSTAADERVDSRIMYTIGKAAEEMGYEEGPVIWHGIPLSVTGKSPFFDRKA